MPKKVCGFSFDCGSMMLQPGLDPESCPNYVTCGKATRLTPDEEIELIRVREIHQQEHNRRQEALRVEYERRIETWRTTRREIAIDMLVRRGCSQTPEQYISGERLTALIESIGQLRQKLAEFEGYLPPEGCVVHRYYVKGYPYNKLMALRMQFSAVQRDKREWTRVIHLSHDNDPRNIEARKGITRMHRLIAVRKQLAVAEEAIAEALALLEAEVEPHRAEEEDF